MLEYFNKIQYTIYLYIYFIIVVCYLDGFKTDNVCVRTSERASVRACVRAGVCVCVLESM